MITTFAFNIIGLLLNGLFVLFQAVTLSLGAIIPQQVPDAFHTLFSYAGYGTYFWVDMPDMIAALLVSFVVLITIYSIKLVQWAWAYMPWVGHHQEFPESAHKAISQHENFKRVMKGRGVNASSPYKKQKKRFLF